MRTFSKKGLNKLQVDFLTNIEKEYFKGAEINRDLLYKHAVNYKGTEKAKQLIEAFDYWTFLPRPIIRESYKRPVKLSELLTPNRTGFYLYGHDDRVTPTEKTKELLKNGLIYDIKPENYYFELTGDALYIKYQHIIGSRFIAFIKKDI